MCWILDVSSFRWSVQDRNRFPFLHQIVCTVQCATMPLIDGLWSLKTSLLACKGLYHTPVRLQSHRDNYGLDKVGRNLVHELVWGLNSNDGFVGIRISLFYIPHSWSWLNHLSHNHKTGYDVSTILKNDCESALLVVLDAVSANMARYPRLTLELVSGIHMSASSLSHLLSQPPTVNLSHQEKPFSKPLEESVALVFKHGRGIISSFAVKECNVIRSQRWRR